MEGGHYGRRPLWKRLLLWKEAIMEELHYYGRRALLWKETMNMEGGNYYGRTPLLWKEAIM